MLLRLAYRLMISSSSKPEHNYRFTMKGAHVASNSKYLLHNACLNDSAVASSYQVSLSLRGRIHQVPAKLPATSLSITYQDAILLSNFVAIINNDQLNLHTRSHTPHIDIVSSWGLISQVTSKLLTNDINCPIKCLVL